ncbi:hypothetical protein AB0O22_38760 [Streptomyces sp. NPDC091204]
MITQPDRNPKRTWNRADPEGLDVIAKPMYDLFCLCALPYHDTLA